MVSSPALPWGGSCRYRAAIVSFDEQRALLVVRGDESRATSVQRRRAISRALSAPRDVVVDLSGLRFADCSLMLDLAILAQRLRARGKRLEVRAPSPQIRRLVELVGLHRMPAVALV